MSVTGGRGISAARVRIEHFSGSWENYYIEWMTKLSIDLMHNASTLKVRENSEWCADNKL